MTASTGVYSYDTTPTGREDKSVLIRGICGGADWHVEVIASTDGLIVKWDTLSGDCQFTMSERKEIGAAFERAIVRPGLLLAISAAIARSPSALAEEATGDDY